MEAELRKEIRDHVDPDFREDIMAALFGRYLQYGRDPSRVNLGQGFPDFDVPAFVKDALIEAITVNSNHQYCRPAGPLGLAQELSLTYGPRFGKEIDPATEVIVSTGATEVFSTLISVVTQPGDEIVYIEPQFAYFIPLIHSKGRKGVPVSILGDQGYEFNHAKFEAAFTERTKAFIINSPHNPTGKVFSREEIEYICRFLIEKFPNVLVICDDVYCDYPFTGNEHVQIGSLPGMWSRTYSIFSFGKIFGATGWRLGVGIGPKQITGALINYQVLKNYCGSTPLLMAAEKIYNLARTQPFNGEANYYEYTRKLFEKQAQSIISVFEQSDLDLDLLPCQGGYFLSARINRAILKMPIKYFYKDFETNTERNEKLATYEDWLNLPDVDFCPDYAYCNYLCFEKKVCPWPISAFYDTLQKKPKDKKQVNMIRIAICRRETTVQKLAEVLKH
jgi:aspartate/methionine/tyrosine aminotransferase